MRKIFGLIAVILLLSLRCFGQATTAELSGTVEDASGAVIAGAQVVANNIATNIAHSTVSEKNGHYVVGQLPPGDYTITVEAKGFSKLVQTGLSLQVNQQAQMDLTLKVGAQTETVEVVSQAPLLESESSSVGTVIGQQMVNQLPLNGRNFTQLATLSPGVTGVGQSATGTIESGTRPDNRRPASEIFSNGNREGDNNFLIDGVDDNERLTLSIVVRPPVAAVREFKIQTNLYSADIGRNSGAVIDVITKSGTNQLHGSVFEYIRNSAVDARSYFNRPPSPFPSFRLNQFGFSVGGPVIIPKVYNGKNRTFFFADYEGFRNTTQSFILGNVPTLKERTGDFSEVETTSGVANIYDPLTTVANPANPGGFIRTVFPNNFIPLNRRDPISVKMINAYPLPTSTGRFNNYSSNLLQSQNANSFDGRMDEQLTQKDLLFGRYSYQSTTNIAPSTYPVTTIPGISTPVHLSDEASFAGTSATPTSQTALGYTRVFTPTIVNDFRFGFSRYKLDYVPVDFVPNGGLGNQLGIPNSNVTPREQNITIFSPSTYLGVGQTRSLPLNRRENTFQVFDNLVWTKGSHTHKAWYRFPSQAVDDLPDQHGQRSLQLLTGADGLQKSRRQRRRQCRQHAAWIPHLDRSRLHISVPRNPHERVRDLRSRRLANDKEVDSELRIALGLLQPPERGTESLGKLQSSYRKDGCCRTERSEIDCRCPPLQTQLGPSRGLRLSGPAEYRGSRWLWPLLQRVG